MCFTLTAIVGTDPCFQFVRTQQPVWFRHGPLAMHPFRLNGIEPRAFAGQPTDDEAYAARAPFDLLIVLTQPGLHGMAAVPRGVIPDQQHGGGTLLRQAGGAPGEKIDSHCTDRTSCDKPQPHLLRLLRQMPHQQPIAGQRLGIRIGLGPGQLLQFLRGAGLSPAMLVGLGQPTPPDLIAPAQGPCWMGGGESDQPVAPFFFRA